MRKLVFDIEANGLNEVIINKKGEPLIEGDTVWCICIQDLDNGTMYSSTSSRESIEWAIEMLREADLIIGHNIVMFDIPMLERLYGKIDTPVYDTLIVSKLMYPDRKNHPLNGNSLANWGHMLGCEKIEYSGGWDEYSGEMREYCERDVVITAKIYNHQQDFVHDCNNPKIVKLEHIVAKIVANQISNGIGFDIEAADKLEQDLLMEKVTIEDDLSTIFSPITEERWSDKTGKRLKDKVTHFNPASRKQISERLHEKYGWKAPLTDKGNPKVDSSILKELKYPEAKKLVKYFDLVKLLGMLRDWITRYTSSRDGRIHGSVNTQGTVTGRMTASQPNLQQVSGDSRARALFIPRPGWLMVGIDAASLEARLLANRMASYDGGSYAIAVVHGDIHAVNQQAAGLSSRKEAKTFFYALIYGAGNAKIGKIIHRSAKRGGEAKRRFLKELPAMKKVIERCKFQVAKKGTITLLDGREVPCRSEHAALNVQIQGDGAIIMKLAQCLFSKAIQENYKDRAVFMATVHDEWQLECEPGCSDAVGELGVECIVEAGKRLGCAVPMDGNYRVGKNWAQCH